MTPFGRCRGARTADLSRLQRFAWNVRASILLFFRPARPPGRRPAWPSHSRLAFGAVAAIAAVVGAVVLLDVASVAAARQLPTMIVFTFQYVTQLGLSGYFLYPIGLTLLVLAIADSPRLSGVSRATMAAISVRLGFVFMAIAVPGLVVAIVKRLIGRARPFVAGDDAWTSLLFVWRASYAAFPSGHATTAFAAAVAIGALFPPLRPIMWIYAVLIAVSRVVVSAHHPSDVIAGAIVGTIGAFLIRDWYASRRLGFAVLADGRIHRLPGPSLRRIKTVARRVVSA